MIEKLYHTESYAEPINSIIKKVNEVVTAINCGTQPASTNTESMPCLLFSDQDTCRQGYYMKCDKVPCLIKRTAYVS